MQEGGGGDSYGKFDDLFFFLDVAMVVQLFYVSAANTALLWRRKDELLNA